MNSNLLAMEMPPKPALLVFLLVVALVGLVMYLIHRTIASGEKKDLAGLSETPPRQTASKTSK